MEPPVLTTLFVGLARRMEHLPFSLIGRRHPEVHRALRLTASAGSLPYGLFLLVSTGITQGIPYRLCGTPRKAGP